MTGKIIYIMSDNRSGSTLLDQLLGANSSIMSLGEVHHLLAYALNDRSLYDPVHPLVCSCGQPVTDCTFWLGVEKQLGRPLSSLRLRPRFLDRRHHTFFIKQIIKRIVKRLMIWRPRLATQSVFQTLLSSRQVCVDSFALFDAIFALTETKFLVDSSKGPLRMRLLYDFDPNRVIVIMLGRNYRGVVLSKMKRGQSLEAGVQAWARLMKQMKLIVEDIPKQQVIRVKYEDLCSQPSKELQRICGLLDIEFSEAMLSRPSTGIHHLGGSPSKFDLARKDISLDDAYMTAFSEEQLQIMRQIADVAAKEWGYD